MLKLNCRLILMLLLLALLGACGDSTETESQKMFDQAKAQTAQKQPAAAEQTLAALVKQYPDSTIAAEARRELAKLQQNRENLVNEANAKLLDSYYQVLSGYKAMYGHYPSSATALDQSDYFFDTDYLAELAGKDFQVSLWFAEDGSSFKVWCLQQGQPQGYLIDHKSAKPRALPRAELLGQVEGGYQAQLLKGGLSLLTPKG